MSQYQCKRLGRFKKYCGRWKTPEDASSRCAFWTAARSEAPRRFRTHESFPFHPSASPARKRCRGGRLATAVHDARIRPTHKNGHTIIYFALYTKNRDLRPQAMSRFGVFVAHFLACAGAARMQVAGCQVWPFSGVRGELAEKWKAGKRESGNLTNLMAFVVSG